MLPYYLDIICHIHHIGINIVFKRFQYYYIPGMVVAFLMVLLLLLFCFISTNACSDPNHHHHQLNNLNSFPRRSDVLLTSRSPHLQPPFPTGVGSGSGEYSTWDAARLFHATRLDWVYTLNSTFVSEAHSNLHNLSIVSLAMNPQIPDANGKTFKTGRILNINGETLVAPWMRNWTSRHAYGCVNNPAYKNLAFTRAKLLVSLGSNVIQHDDPTSNAEAVDWSGGMYSKFYSILPVNLNKICISPLTRRSFIRCDS